MSAASLVLALLLAAATPAPDEDPHGGGASDAIAAHAAETPGRRPTWFALPVLFWLPETRLGLGATGGLHFHAGDAAKASSVFAAAVYTLEGQGSLDVAADVQTPGGAALAARTRAVHFPDAYYGVGPTAPDAARERYTRRFAEAVVSFELPVLGGLRAGPKLDLRAEEVEDVVPGGLLASGAVAGAGGFAAGGAGAQVTFDDRDGAFWPSRGSFVQAWYLRYPEALGSGHAAFARAGLEGRRFLPLGEGRVLGLAAFVEGATEATPFTLLPKLGSTRFLRGFREGRYRDRAAWAAQAELRLPLGGRFSATAFGAFGDVAARVTDFQAETLKVAGGVGARFRLTDEGANIRVDLAASGAGPELYVLVLEAF